MGSNKPSDDEIFEFNWIKARKNAGLMDDPIESSRDKFIRKIKENPLVPIGALVTTGFLVQGIISMSRREAGKSQMMMRGRVLAQAFTIVALVTGICMKASSTDSVQENQNAE